MKAALLPLAGLLAFSVYLVCETQNRTPQSVRQDSERKISYTYDSRTQLCFAVRRGWEEAAVVLVPCTDNVKLLALLP
jgi:hypothetical protein